MPRFPGAFTRRKSAAASEELQNAQANTIAAVEQPSFRVIERKDVMNGRSFDGGARMARASGSNPPRRHYLEPEGEENMFADLKNNRGSGASSTTKGTSTDASSRHSNASTAPSSADMGHGGNDDSRNIQRKPVQETGTRSGSKSSGSGILNFANRTFSFGGQRKNSMSPTKEQFTPEEDVPPVPSIPRQDSSGRERGMTASTASTTSTATPPRLEGDSMDLGGDFGSLMMGMNKRSSQLTLKHEGSAPRSLTGSRVPQPSSLQLDTHSYVNPPPRSLDSEASTDRLMGPQPGFLSQDPSARMSPGPRSQSPASYKASGHGGNSPEDEDAKLLQDSLLAGRYLSGQSSAREESDRFDTNNRFNNNTSYRRPIHSSFTKDDENMFEGNFSRINRVASRHQPRRSSPPRNKVMTPAQFEQYRQDKERQGSAFTGAKPAQNDEDEEEDEINYEDDDDEMEKSKQQARQRRRQEAQMSVYRQQMMKVTGETPMQSEAPSGRPGLPYTMSAPQLNLIKTPSPDPASAAVGADEEEDEEVPLGILQAHGFPHKNRAPSRLTSMGSNPNLRASARPTPPPGRPSSAHGDSSSTSGGQRQSNLPAFARGLPQDPFIGASIAKPAIRESLSYSGGVPPKEPSPGLLPPGGLVGVIASEERSKAMRRGSPNIETQRLMSGGPHAPAFDPVGGIPPHMMYNSMPGGAQGPMPGMPGMYPQMAPPMLTPGDQAQIQMTQQMSQFMQMQMQFMQMMAGQQNGSPGPAQQSPYGGAIPGSQTMVDLQSRQSMMGDQFGRQTPMNDMSGRQSVMGDPMAEPRRLDAGMRTMSMIQPSSASFLGHPGYAGSFRGVGGNYTPSIAPSERSNIGLPGRYRPVSSAQVQLPEVGLGKRSATMSGALSSLDTPKGSTVTVMSKSAEGSDDDDEEGWEAMKAKRDKKRSMWRGKKSFGNELSAIM